MFVGILQFELLVHGAESLKDKRRVVRSVRDRLHREHLVSVAEVAALDNHVLAVMGLALVSNSVTHISSTFDRIIDKLRGLREAELGEVDRQIIRGEHADDVEHEYVRPWDDPDQRRAAAPRGDRPAGEATS